MNARKLKNNFELRGLKLDVTRREIDGNGVEYVLSNGFVITDFKYKGHMYFIARTGDIVFSQFYQSTMDEFDIWMRIIKHLERF
jgi:hypothetical protein